LIASRRRGPSAACLNPVADAAANMLSTFVVQRVALAWPGDRSLTDCVEKHAAPKAPQKRFLLVS